MLTAAHCLIQFTHVSSYDRILIKYHKHNLKVKDKHEQAIVFKPIKIIQNPFYDYRNKGDDIVIVKVVRIEGANFVDNTVFSFDTGNYSIAGTKLVLFRFNCIANCWLGDNETRCQVSFQQSKNGNNPRFSHSKLKLLMTISAKKLIRWFLKHPYAQDSTIPGESTHA